MNSSEEFVSALAAYLSASKRFASHDALDCNGEVFSYAMLLESAQKIAAFVQVHAKDSAYIGLFASRSVSAYAGALGVMLAGKAYVPLNPSFPKDRLTAIIDKAQIHTVLVGSETAEVWDRIGEHPALKTVLLPRETDKASFSSTKGVAFFSCEQFSPSAYHEPLRSETAAAYLLFTSGSTGSPKGISIHHGNLSAYLKWALEALPLLPSDRCSQTFELSFDLSVHDLMVTLTQGACLVIPKAGDLLFPSHYILSRKLTVWFSVPALAMQMKQMGLLKPKSFPALRLALFCGEALPSSTAGAWAEAAPHARILNLYGPTEATIAATLHECQATRDYPKGVVPIGKAFAHMEAAVFDVETRKPVKGDEPGELWLSGPQLAQGYFQDQGLTDAAFVTVNQRRWYRTGDLAQRDSEGDLHFLGRIDLQIKFLGYRIEIGEIEATLRKHSAVETWVVLLHKHEGQEMLIAVYEPTGTVDAAACLEECRKYLPSYMVPSEALAVPSIPVNSNGKIDRRALGILVHQLRQA